MNEKVGELFDRYAGEVDKHLPRKEREDLGLEIRSMLEDSLEDRSQRDGREPDLEMAVAVLEELGPPTEVAASFSPERYLIGPAYYPAFMMVLKITLAVILVTNLLTLVVSLIRSDVVSVWLEPLSELTSSAVGSLGILVLIFALMERNLPNPEKISGKWDPRELVTVSERDRVRRGELILDIGASIAALVAFNFFAHKIGIYNNRNGVWSFTPILAPTFVLYLPWLNIRLVLGLAASVMMLRQESWRPWTRFVAAAIALFGLAILFAMYLGDPVLEVTGRGDLDQLFLLLFIIPGTISLIRQLFRWLRPVPYVIKLKDQR